MSPAPKMEWRPAAGFPSYEVSECGDLRRKSTGTRLRGHINSDGYPEYTLRNANGDRVHISAHMLVLLTFVGPPPMRGMEAAHNDGSRLNAHVSNLRWATRKQNSDDRHLHGTDMRGERNPKARLTAQDVMQIRLEYREIKRPGSGRKVSELDERYGITRSTTLRIARGVYWPHLPMPDGC